MLEALKRKKRRGKHFLKASVGLVETTDESDIKGYRKVSTAFQEDIARLESTAKKYRENVEAAAEAEKNLLTCLLKILTPHEDLGEEEIPLGIAAQHYERLFQGYANAQQESLRTLLDEKVMTVLEVYRKNFFPELKKKTLRHDDCRSDYDSYRGKLQAAKKSLEAKVSKGSDDLMHEEKAVERSRGKFERAESIYQNSHAELLSLYEGLLSARREQFENIFLSIVAFKLESGTQCNDMKQNIMHEWPEQILIPLRSIWSPESAGGGAASGAYRNPRLQKRMEHYQ
eukprot:g1155.t1